MDFAAAFFTFVAPLLHPFQFSPQLLCILAHHYYFTNILLYCYRFYHLYSFEVVLEAVATQRFPFPILVPVLGHCKESVHGREIFDVLFGGRVMKIGSIRVEWVRM